MAIIGYRELTSEELETARQEAGVPSNAATFKTDNGQWVFYNGLMFYQYFPLTSWAKLSFAQRSIVLRKPGPWTYLIAPLMPITDDATIPAPSTPPTPTPPIFTPQPPDITPLPVEQPATFPTEGSLRSFLTISEGGIEIFYTKDSMTPIPAKTVTVSNSSQTATVAVKFENFKGVSFSPNDFSVEPQTNQAVVVSFDPAQMNTLVEGITGIACAVTLRVTAIKQPVPVTPPPGTPPVITPTNGTWLEERFGGSPRSISFAQIFAQPPFATRNVSRINVTRSDITTEQSIRWTKRDTFQGGTYKLNITVDDGVRVYLDDQLVLDQWHDANTTSYSQNINVTAGEHTVKVLYYNSIDDGLCALDMILVSASPGTTDPITPPTIPTTPEPWFEPEPPHPVPIPLDIPLFPVTPPNSFTEPVVQIGDPFTDDGQIEFIIPEEDGIQPVFVDDNTSDEISPIQLFFRRFLQ